MLMQRARAVADYRERIMTMSEYEERLHPQRPRFIKYSLQAGDATAVEAGVDASWLPQQHSRW